MNLTNRSSGVLLHISSLPGDYGIGSIGKEAIKFIEYLSSMNQKFWQILPLGFTANNNSPYDLISSFAGNPLLISISSLVEDGYISKNEVNFLKSANHNKVNFKKIKPIKVDILYMVAERILSYEDNNFRFFFKQFCKENKYWLDDFALFITIKKIFSYKCWTEWDTFYKYGKKNKLIEFRNKYSIDIEKVKIIQFLFYKQWSIIKEYCKKNHVYIIGDLPIYVSHDSAEVWSNSELFTLDRNCESEFVSGVPPCDFSRTGQLWGHPLYKWDIHIEKNFSWWKFRFKRLYDMVDIIRIDHFNGFAKYWKIPAGKKNAVEGEWVEGPGKFFFKDLFSDIINKDTIIAENLGAALESSKIITDEFDIPGMEIIQFSFKNKSNLFSHDYSKNSVVYTGTHDNDTAVGWFQSEFKNQLIKKNKILNYLNSDGSEIHWDLIKLAYSSKSNTVIIPLQDFLGLDTNARMNIPGTNWGNWNWRFNWDMLTSSIIERTNNLSKKYNRHL